MLLLLAGCPILEDFKAFNLFVYNDVWEESFCQVIQRLNLSKLIRADITDSCYFPMEALFNLEFLKIQLMEMYTLYDFATSTIIWLTWWSTVFGIRYYKHSTTALNFKISSFIRRHTVGGMSTLKGKNKKVGWTLSSLHNAFNYLLEPALFGTLPLVTYNIILC